MGMKYFRQLAAVILLGCGFTLGRSHCQAASFTWNSGSGDWSVASNWTPNGVPGPNDAATVSSGNPMVGTDTTVSNLNLGGGTISGSAVLTITKAFNWSSGILDGS